MPRPALPCIGVSPGGATVTYQRIVALAATLGMVTAPSCGYSIVIRRPLHPLMPAAADRALLVLRRMPHPSAALG